MFDPKVVNNYSYLYYLLSNVKKGLKMRKNRWHWWGGVEWMDLMTIERSESLTLPLCLVLHDDDLCVQRVSAEFWGFDMTKQKKNYISFICGNSNLRTHTRRLSTFRSPEFHVANDGRRGKDFVSNGKNQLNIQKDGGGWVVIIEQIRQRQPGQTFFWKIIFFVNANMSFV